MLRVNTILIALLVIWSMQASAASNDLSAAGVAEFNAAYGTWDGARFAAAAELFRRATTNAPMNATNFYWLGAAQFHRMLQLQYAPANSTNQFAADAALDDAVGALKTAVKLCEGHAESHALLGTLYGMKINGSVLRAAWFGPRVAKHRGKAMESGAHNPRVQYLLGTCQFHTAKKPAAWREALATLLKAEKLFAADVKVASGPLEPRWGYATCLTFIGRSYELLDQPKEAAEYFRRALALHPVDHLASEGLKRVSAKK